MNSNRRDVNLMVAAMELNRGDVNSMVAAMELGCGGRRLEVRCFQVVRWQMVRSTHAAYFNIKSGVLGKEDYCMVHTT